MLFFTACNFDVLSARSEYTETFKLSPRLRPQNCTKSSLLETQNFKLAALFATSTFGGLITGKGVQDTLNNKKIAGISKIVFGISILGVVGFVYAYHSNAVPVLNCSYSAESTHPNCSRILDLVHSILNRTSSGLISFDNNPIPKITEKDYDKESLTCESLQEMLFCEAEFYSNRKRINGYVRLNNTFDSAPETEHIKTLNIWIESPPLPVKLKLPFELIQFF